MHFIIVLNRGQFFFIPAVRPGRLLTLLVDRQYCPATRNPMKSLIPERTGFSVVELLTAMTLMGIIAAIALPSWSRLLPDYALNNSVRQIQSELNSIRMRAVAEGVGFEMAYSKGANTYAIQRELKTLATKPIAEGTIITQAGVILFSPRGTASANRVRVATSTGVCKQIVVSPTGRVRICVPASCTQDC